MAAAAAVSQSNSTRLPSPPPFTEVQFGPKSPSVGTSFPKDVASNVSHGLGDGSMRRIRPGTKAADMAFGPPLIPLNQVDSPFQLQEHLKALYNNYTKPANSATVVPITHEVAVQLAEPPEGVERALWLYELCRFLTIKVNDLIVAFFAEDPPCSSQICPEMRAAEWQYLCAVHDPPKSCCAIDYCCHTLDWATNILTSPKYFPSRLILGSDAGGGPQTSMKHLTNVFRRLYRIFAHAWFQHREAFWQVEANEGLYILFKTVCDMYDLIQEDSYTVPPEAEGVDVEEPAGRQSQPELGRKITILRKESEDTTDRNSRTAEKTSLSTDTNTRRHKSSPSADSRITTITEDNEEHHKVPELSQKSVLGGHSLQTSLGSRDGSDEQMSDNSGTSQITVEVKETEPEPDEAVEADVGKREGQAGEKSENIEVEPMMPGPEMVKSETEAETAQLTEDPSAENAEPEPELESTLEPEKTSKPEMEEQPNTENSKLEELGIKENSIEEPKAQHESITEPNPTFEPRIEPKSEPKQEDKQELGFESELKAEDQLQRKVEPELEQQQEQPEEGSLEPKTEPVQQQESKPEDPSESKTELETSPEPHTEDISEPKLEPENQTETVSKTDEGP